MQNNGSGFGKLLQELESLEGKISDASPTQAFASANSKSFLSLLQFAALLPADSPRHAQSIEATWQIGNAPAETALDLPSEIRKLLEQSKRLCQAPAAPIVAVLGLLNAGKSSLVSTYLSDENRRRILVGAGNAQGTHRFVLWLPESWRHESTLWLSVQERLKSVFGCDSEPLSSDPDQAVAQYNDTAPRRWIDPAGIERVRETIEIPLIATDPQLNRWGLALMDCPDVQTGFLPNRLLPAGGNSLLFHEQSQSIAEARLEVLANAAPLCSAFIVVLPANAMHDQTVSRLLRVLADRMPSVKQILAVNRVPRRYKTSEIQTELKALYDSHTISRHYMAYGFDGPQQRDRIPSPPVGLEQTSGTTLPLFFRIDQHPIAQPPLPIPAESWLLNIGSQLDQRGLFEDVLNSTTSKLQLNVRHAIDRSHAYIRSSLASTASLQASVANACLDFSTDRSTSGSTKIRLQVSRQIIQQVSASLERTAPWWAMPGRWTARLAETSKASIATATNWFQIPKWFSGKTEAVGHWIRSRWTSGQSGKIVTADALLYHIQQHDRRGDLRLDDEEHDSLKRQQVQAACQRAIDRFQKESLIQLDDQQLDQFTADMWSRMPITKRLITGFAPAGVLFAPLLAVVMVPLDFGGSAVLLFASMKELLLAGAAGVGLAMVGADSMPQIAESEAAWQQLGDLYAVLCDELGLPRPRESQMPTVVHGLQSRRMSVSRIPIGNSQSNLPVSPMTAPIIPAIYEPNPKTIAGIEESLRRILDN